MNTQEYSNKIKEIDIIFLLSKIWNNRINILISIIGGGIIGTIIAFSLPKTYKVDIIISPETGQSGNGNNIAGMASMLGINSIPGAAIDAVNSTMFPEIIKSTPFILDIYNTKVISQKQQKEFNLADYIIQEKQPWWNYIFKVPFIIKEMFSPTKRNNIKKESTVINPYRLTEEQTFIISKIKSALSATEDKKSGMTIISTKFQDPEVAASIADTTVTKLQQYIINYRTKKAQEDCKYLENLCNEKKREYLQSQQIYADFIDTNRNIILQKTQTEGTRLQNEMNMAFQIYSQIETQLQMAKAKVQEAKPVFAIVEPATVPLGPSSPNKPLIIVVFTFLGLISGIAWTLLGKDLWNSLKAKKEK